MPIPTTIARSELVEALKPLCDLLGTSVKNFYVSPGMTIGEDVITFNVPVRHEEDPTGRAEGTRAPGHPQGRDVDEIVYAVRVEVDVDR